MKIEFKNSNLQATINTVNSIEGLNRHKNAAQGAIVYWEKQKEEKQSNVDGHIQFFKDALHLCNTKLQGKEQ
tara:strand:- start:418 stop:633 length:216 start_codon:yes stop_codon:yes gene_type:complete